MKIGYITVPSDFFIYKLFHNNITKVARTLIQGEYVACWVSWSYISWLQGVHDWIYLESYI